MYATVELLRSGAAAGALASCATLAGAATGAGGAAGAGAAGLEATTGGAVGALAPVPACMAFCAA
jgi:hypothetical protein